MRLNTPQGWWLLAAVLVAVAVVSTPVVAQATLLDQVHTIAAADTGVPVEHDVTLAAGSYDLTLTDLGAALPAPFSAPLASVKVAVTNGASVVGTPLVGAGTLHFSTTSAGTYTVRVIGAPGPNPGSGPFGVSINNSADGTPVAGAGFSDNIALPPTAVPSNTQVVNANFTVQTSGTYQLTLTDLSLPKNLDTLTLALVQQGGSIVQTLTVMNGTPASTSAAVPLTANTTYSVFGLGTSNSGAGLYSVTVTAGGTTAFSQTVPVGGVALIGSAGLSAGSYTLHLVDFSFPAKLASVGAMATLNGQPAAPALAAAGDQPITAVDGTYQVFAVGTAVANPGTGSYAVELRPASGAAVVSSARTVGTGAAGAAAAFVFCTAIATAGPYRIQLADYQFPGAFSGLALAAVQGSAMVGSPLSAPGNLDITAAAGTLCMLVFAHPSSTNAALAPGLFGVDVLTGTSGAPVFATTQGVGAAFAAHKITIATAGSYDVTLGDVGFPAPFATLDAVATSGTSNLGSIYGSGKFSFTATTGDYFINLIALPAPVAAATPDEAGTYSLHVAPSPPAPTVTLTADSTTVSSGGTVNLTWSSQNATSCTASNGWSGTRNPTGTEKSAALTAVTTFTLTCTGSGGSAAQSVTVNIQTSTGGNGSGGGHGGGGAIEFGILAALAGALVLRRSRRH